MYSQLDYMKNRNLGYQKEHVIYLSKQEELVTRFETAKDELLQQSGIVNVTAVSNLASFG